MSNVLPNRPPVRLPTHLDLPSTEEDFLNLRNGEHIRLPSHLDLPDQDDTIVTNFREHPQGLLLSSSILPVLRRKRPDDHFAIGQNTLIYAWSTEPPLRGSRAPDWFYVPGVPPNLDGDFRRSYVMWAEHVPPAVVLEFASGDGSYERDLTPLKGKFWIYEQLIQAAYYGIFHIVTGDLEVYHLVDRTYHKESPNARGHYFLDNMGVALGVWCGRVFNDDGPWLRWFDANGQVLPSGEELAEIESQRVETEHLRAEAESQRAEAEHLRAEAERQRVERLAQRLRELGVDPDTI